jgi:hypothetical protein
MSWWNVIAAGVSSAISSRNADKNADRSGLNFDEQRRMANLDSNQERETLLYQTLLEEDMRQRRRNERVRGGKNFAQFSSNIPGYTNKAPMSGVDKPFTPAPRIEL